MSPRTKGWSGKPNPLRKWGRKTTLSPAARVGMIWPLAGSLCAMFAARYPALRRSFISFSVMEEASHLPLEPDPAMVGGGGGGEKDGSFFSGARAWEIIRLRLEEGVGKKGGIYCPLIGGENANRPPTYALKLSYSQCGRAP